MKNKRNKKLRDLVGKLLLIASIFPCVLLIWVASFLLKEEATMKYESDVRYKLTTLGSISNEYNDSIETAFSMVESDKELVEKLENKDRLDELKDHIETVSNFLGDSIVDAGICSIPTKGLITLNNDAANSKDVLNEKWVKLALEDSGALIEVSTETEENGETYVTYAKTLSKSLPSENGDKPKTVDIGIMYIKISLNEMFETGKSIVLTPNSNVLVFDKNYKVIFDRNSELTNKTINDNEWFIKIARAKNKKFIDIKLDGEEYIAYKETNRLTNITIVAMVPTEDILSDVSLTIRPLLIFSTIVMVLILTLGYFFSKKITRPLSNIVNDIKPFKNGDFRSEIKIREDYTSEMKEIVDTLNEIRIGLSDIVKNVKDASNTLEHNSTGLAEISVQSYGIMDEIVGAISNISSDTENNVTRIASLADVTDDLSSEITNIRGLSEDILSSSNSISEFSIGGQGIISKLKGSFEENNIITSDVIEKIKEVSTVSKEINTITDSIKSITKETNLLSINASIEASKAGQAGKGFAVVADSIRSLANQSEESTKKIEHYTTTIINTIDSLEAKVSSLSSINHITAKDVDETYSHFNKIIDLIDKLNGKINTVNESMRFIDENKNIVISNIENISESSQAVSTSTEEVTASIEEQSAQLQEITSSALILSRLANELQDLLSRFKTVDDNILEVDAADE